MSNRTQAPMQPFACVEPSDAGDAGTVYMPLHGFTAVDLGYQPGNAVSNLVNKMDEPPFTATRRRTSASIRCWRRMAACPVRCW
jgi:hypothetical protein